MDSNGIWEGMPGFDGGNRIYAMEMKLMEFETADEYLHMLDLFERRVQQLADESATTDGTFNLVTWSSFEANYVGQNKKGSVKFYTVGDARYIMNMDVGTYYFSKNDSICVPKDSEMFYSIETASYHVKLKNNVSYPTETFGQGKPTYGSEPCRDIFSMLGDVTNRVEDDSEISIDARSLTSALAANLGLNTDLTTILDSEISKMKFKIDEYYPGMEPVICFDEQWCGISFGQNVAIPFIVNGGVYKQFDPLKDCWFDFLVRCRTSASCELNNDYLSRVILVFVPRQLTQQELDGDDDYNIADSSGDDEEVFAFVQSVEKSATALHDAMVNLIGVHEDNLDQLRDHAFKYHAFAANMASWFQKDLSYIDINEMRLWNYGYACDFRSASEIYETFAEPLFVSSGISMFSFEISKHLTFFEKLAGPRISSYGGTWNGLDDISHNDTSSSSRRILNQFSYWRN